MADNVTLNQMTAGDTVGADDIGGVKFQRIKLIKGADGVNDGDVSSTSPLPVTGAPLDNVNDSIKSVDSTDKLMNGTTELTPKYAIIQESSSGNNAVVAAVASKKIRVLAYNFIANGTVNAKFQSDGGGTPVDLTGLKYCVANVGICAPYNPKGWFESASGKSLDINLSAAVAIGGELVYVEV